MNRQAGTTGALVASVLLVMTLAASGAVGGEESPGPWLGVRLGGPVEADQGVRIARIFEGSPADRAGLRARDIILSFGNEAVSSLQDLIGKIRGNDPGAWVQMTVLRGDDELDLDVRLTTRPEVIKKDGMRSGWIGVAAIDLPDSLREHFGAPPGSGVMISEVRETSPAEAAGFRLGDVVFEVGGYPVSSVRMLNELVAGGGVGNEYEFEVARDGALLVLEAEIDRIPEETE